MARIHHKRVDPAGDWTTRAACRDTDPATFFQTEDKSQRETAKLHCETCPVRTECLDYAIANRLDDGVWGGCSERERLRMRKQRREQVA